MVHWEENTTFAMSTNSTIIPQVLNFTGINIFRGVLGLLIIIVKIAESYCIKKWTGLKMVTRTMFINLAASDILYGVASLLAPFLTFPQTDGICVLALPLNVISKVACSTSIMFLAFDIMAVAWYHDSIDPQLFFTLPFIRTVMGITWFLLLALGIWIAVEVDRYDCGVDALFQIMPTGVAIFSICVQTFISFTCYGITFAVTAQRIQKLKSDLNSENLLQTSVVIKRLQRNIKLAKLAVSLGVLYLVSLGPNIVMITASRLLGVSIPYVITGLTGLLVPLNSLGNCVIYWWRSLEFRIIWRQMFSCNLNTNRIHPGSV